MSTVTSLYKVLGHYSAKGRETLWSKCLKYLVFLIYSFKYRSVQRFENSLYADGAHTTVYFYSIFYSLHKSQINLKLPMKKPLKTLQACLKNLFVHKSYLKLKSFEACF